MKTALIIIFISFTLIAYLGNEANAITRDKNVLEGFNPSLMASGTLSMPKKISSNSYEPSYGFLVSTGWITPSQNQANNTVSSMAIVFSRDSFALKNDIEEDEKATITSVHFSNLDHVPIVISDNFLFMPYTGGSTGLSKFSIADNVFDDLDKSTLTELEDENGDIQSSGAWKFGAQVALKDLIPGMELLSVTYSYDLMTVERAWMPWHSIINALIFGTVTGIFDAVANIAPDSPILGLAIMGLKVGATTLWYNFDYSHHNWPYKDHEPLKYHRQSVSISSAF